MKKITKNPFAFLCKFITSPQLFYVSLLFLKLSQLELETDFMTTLLKIVINGMVEKKAA
jgi:hypothetical protein